MPNSTALHGTSCKHLSDKHLGRTRCFEQDEHPLPEVRESQSSWRRWQFVFMLPVPVGELKRRPALRHGALCRPLSHTKALKILRKVIAARVSLEQDAKSQTRALVRGMAHAVRQMIPGAVGPSEGAIHVAASCFARHSGWCLVAGSQRFDQFLSGLAGRFVSARF